MELSNSPTVIIAEDDFVIREGMLKSLLEPQFTIVASVDSGQDAITAAAEHNPTIVLLDISLPEVAGFDAARQILADHPDCKVLFVSNYRDRGYVGNAKEMGASGYVLKWRAESDLVPAIEAALAGDFYQSNFY